jgi:Lipid A 3-O-deacylase (PagL)
MRYYILLIFFFIHSAKASSSGYGLPEKKKGPLFFVAPHFGFIAAHTKKMEHLIRGHSYGVQGQILFQSSGTKKWQKSYNHPDSGLDFFLNHTGNPQQLGWQFNAAYFLNLPLNKSHASRRKASFDFSEKKFHWLGLSIGAGYASKIWDLRENHQAAVLGSHFNAALILQYTLKLAQLNSAQIRAGLRVTHFSNGAFQLPNLGTNNLSVFMGFYLNNKPKPPIPFDKAQVVKVQTEPRDSAVGHFCQSLVVSFGAKETPPANGKKYIVNSWTYLMDYRLSNKSSIGLGADAFYSAVIHKLIEEKDEKKYPASRAIQAGVHFCYSLHFDRFELKISQGYYLRDKWTLDGHLYNRFGLRYHWNNHFFGNLMLKTHFAKADFVELGIGYKF